MTSQQVFLGKVPAETKGVRLHVIVAPNHTRCAFLVQADTHSEECERAFSERLYFLHELIEETSYGCREAINFAFSYNGEKIATCVKKSIVGEDDVRYVISINGVPTYTSRLDTIHHLVWLSNTELAWDGWKEDKTGRMEGGIQTIVNGENRTGTLEFEPMGTGRGVSLITLFENGQRCIIREDGTRTTPVPAEGITDSFEKRRANSWSHQPQPDELRDQSGQGIRISYQGVVGPLFHAIETGGGMHSYSFTADESFVGYVGMSFGDIPNRVQNWLGRKLDKSLRGSEEDIPLWVWPLTFFFNPYTGPGHAWITMSKRYTPVVCGKSVVKDGATSVSGYVRWAKSYLDVHDHFFTPGGQFVVTARTKGGYCVVIDEVEGPILDGVSNVRFLKDRISYIGMKDGLVFRITTLWDPPAELFSDAP